MLLFFFKLRNNSNISLLLCCNSALTAASRGGVAVAWLVGGGVKRWRCGRDSCTAPCPFWRRTADPPGWCSRPETEAHCKCSWSSQLHFWGSGAVAAGDVFLQRRQSRCRATWLPRPPGTCRRPRLGSRSRGSWSRTWRNSLRETREI